MNWLKKMSFEQPNKNFINHLTFKEVYNRVEYLAEKLSSYVKNEKRVAICSGNSVDTALFFFTLMYLKKEVLMLNAHLASEEIKKQLKALNIRVVFTCDENFISYDEVYQNKKESNKLIEEIDHEKIVAILNTSATTGEFKAVPIKWKQFVFHAKASQKSLGVEDEDNWLVILPMYHISGLSILIRSLYNGTQITILEKFDEDQVIKLIESNAINMISIVPTMLNRIIDRIEKHNLRVVLIGGEFIPKVLVEKCILKNIPIYKTYGMTETTSQCTTFPVLKHLEKIDSVGFPIEGVKIRIHSPDEKGIGVVLVKSPMLMDGYIGKESINGYFNTGDIGYMDDSGFLYILDRHQDIIISGGENIYPKEIENVLYKHPEIIECAVIGSKDEKWGQIPVLYVVSSLNEETILKYLSKRLAKYKLPQKIVYLDKLPRNSSGKVLKSKLKEAD
ncbi:MAG: o-succinylbenzoate--CoA ligase [Candidatus Gastranaerophilaceae bacterium]|jgi:O-succinylbenzoic acid--CoA ligase